MTNIEKVARDIARNLGPFKMKLLRQENYSGEHREWYEEITIPKDADIVREISTAAIAAMQQAQEPVAWRYTRADGHFFLTPKRCRDGYPEADGWTEEALYAGPTPPAGGSDAE